MVARRILCLAHPKRNRARVLAQAMGDGIARYGDEAFIGEEWYGDTDYHAVVAYGWGYWQECFEAYRAAGKPFVFIDGGYWGREKSANVLDGYHKVTVNCRHPVVRLDLPSDRVTPFGLEPKPWRSEGRHILLAGMSAKNAGDLDLKPEEWERRAIAALKRCTDRVIVYRPKPTWARARPIPGTRFSPPKEPLAAVLTDCWAVVTHHSNVGVDALIEGVPIYTEDGAAKPFSMDSVASIERPVMPAGRAAFMAGLAYCQWSLAEMSRGECWDHIRKEAFGGETL